MYKYVNKRDITITIGGLTFTPYSGHSSQNNDSQLDILSNGWDFDRYVNGVLTNSSNDDILVGQIKQFTTNPGLGWLKCDGKQYLRSTYPELSSISNLDGCELTSYIGDGVSAPNTFTGGYVGGDGRLYVKDYSSNNQHMWSTIDQGVTWVKHINMIPTPSWEYWFYSGNNNLMIGVGDSRNIIYSTDNGLTWNIPTTPPTNPNNLKISEATFDGSKFVIISKTSYEEQITSGKFIAYSTDGNNWTTVILPAIHQTHDWTSCRSMGSNYTRFTSDKYYNFTLYGTTIYTPGILDIGDPPVASWATYLYSVTSPNTAIFIDCDNRLNKATNYGGSRHDRHPEEADIEDYVGMVATVGSTSVCFGKLGGLFMSNDSGTNWTYQRGALPYFGWPNGLGIGNNFFLCNVYSSEAGTNVTLRWIPNPTKFCIPSLIEKHGFASYIYAGPSQL